MLYIILDFPGSSDHKVSAYSARDQVQSWVRKILWRRKWQPTPVFLPRESRGQRSVVGYSPWSYKESDMTEQLSTAQQQHMETIH